MKIKHLLLSFRPKTLTASFGPILVGSSLAFLEGHFSWTLMLWTLLSGTCIQIGTNLFNDVLDFQKGADTEERHGPMRVTQSQLMSEKKVFIMAFLFYGLSILFAIPLILKGGMIIVILGALALASGYLYTGTKWALAYTGLAEVFVILLFGLSAVGSMFYLHTGGYNETAFWSGLSVGLFCTGILVVNNLRDVHTDKKVNKKTLAVRLGFEQARFELISIYLLGFMIQTFFFLESLFWAGALPLVTFPLVLSLIKKVFKTQPSREYNKFLSQSALTHMLYCLLLSLGFFLEKVWA